MMDFFEHWAISVIKIVIGATPIFKRSFLYMIVVLKTDTINFSITFFIVLQALGIWLYTVWLTTVGNNLRGVHTWMIAI